MDRLAKLEAAVRELYAQQNPDRDRAADWMMDNHVAVVADNATALAQRFGANQELARAAALLHDIADVKMARASDQHEQASLDLARELLQQIEYSEEEIATVVDDAIRKHSCRNNERPDSLEGKVLATADALAHMQTDFYFFFAWLFGSGNSTYDRLREELIKKIERDFYRKICFDEVRVELQPRYDFLKECVPS